VIAMTISLFWFAGRPPAARGTMTVTYGASTIHDHSDSVGTIVVTLDPDPIQNAGEFFLRGDPSAAFQTAMTDSLAALDWKNDLTFTYDGSLGGTLTIDVYNAKMKTATAGGAQLLTHYNRAASDPAASSLFWIQVVDTTAPNGGETAPYPDVYFSGYGAGAKLPFYYRPDELNLDANPYVGSEPIRSGNYTVNGQNYNYDLAFWDWPSRSWVNTWHAELFLASYDATTKAVKVYDGIYWGFTIVPEPSSLAMLTVGIAGLALARFTRRAA
jgi:hypothetical protein